MHRERSVEIWRGTLLSVQHSTDMQMLQGKYQPQGSGETILGIHKEIVLIPTSLTIQGPRVECSSRKA